jgi:hypothetical protein
MAGVGNQLNDTHAPMEAQATNAKIHPNQGLFLLTLHIFPATFGCVRLVQFLVN